MDFAVCDAQVYQLTEALWPVTTSSVDYSAVILTKTEMIENEIKLKYSGQDTEETKK